MSFDIVEMIVALEERIRSRRYLPGRVWKLYKIIIGDLGIGALNRVRKTIRPCNGRKGPPPKKPSRAKFAEPQNGYCVDCGKALHQSFICKHCGCDNQWATVLGLTVKKENI